MAGHPTTQTQAPKRTIPSQHHGQGGTCPTRGHDISCCSQHGRKVRSFQDTNVSALPGALSFLKFPRWSRWRWGRWLHDLATGFGHLICFLGSFLLHFHDLSGAMSGAMSGGGTCKVGLRTLGQLIPDQGSTQGPTHSFPRILSKQRMHMGKSAVADLLATATSVGRYPGYGHSPVLVRCWGYKCRLVDCTCVSLVFQTQATSHVHDGIF